MRKRPWHRISSSLGREEERESERESEGGGGGGGGGEASRMMPLLSSVLLSDSPTSKYASLLNISPGLILNSVC